MSDVKTYPILRYLTDEELERGLAVPYTPVLNGGRVPRSEDGCCFLGEALRIVDEVDGSLYEAPGPFAVIDHLHETRPMVVPSESDELEALVDEFIYDFDGGLITDIEATVRASRAL